METIEFRPGRCTLNYRLSIGQSCYRMMACPEKRYIECYGVIGVLDLGTNLLRPHCPQIERALRVFF